MVCKQLSKQALSVYRKPRSQQCVYISNSSRISSYIRFSFFKMLSFLCLISESTAMPLNGRISPSTPGVLDLNVKRNVGSYGSNSHLARRTAPYFDLENAQTYYTVSMSVGTPGTEMDFLLDTGSSDFWVNANSSHGDYFDYEKSKTFLKNDTDSKFGIAFGDGTKASGFWGTDKISVFDHTFDASFGLATENDVVSEILGIGLPQGETTVHGVDADGNLYPTYTNFPQLLKDNALIERVAYSLWLDGAVGGNGTLLFGGVDHSKYQGNLTVVPIVNDGSIPVAKKPTSLSVILHQAKLSDSDSGFEKNIEEPVLLDTGSTLCVLPSHFVDSLGKALGGSYSDKLQVYEVDCDNTGTVSFNFSGTEISTNVSDLLLPLEDVGGSNKNGRCALGAYKTDKGKFVLGDPFLRSAYVVFDLEGLEIGLAQAVPARSFTGSPDIEEISNKIPSATSAPSYSHTEFATSVTSS